MRYCGHFLIKAEGGAKNYKRDHPLSLSSRPFTVVIVQQKGIQTRLCKSTLYAVTNRELTSSHILSVLSLNCCTSIVIAGAVTPRMLSKQRTPHTIHVKTTFFSKHHQNSVYGELRLLQVNGNVNRTVREEVFHWKSSVSILLQRVGPSTLRIFSPQYFNTA